MSLGEGCPAGRGVLSRRVSGAILGPWMWISIVLEWEKGVLHKITHNPHEAIRNRGWHCVLELKFLDDASDG